MSAVNLSRYGDAMMAAWRDVLNTETPTNWALYGYEGQTYDLKVVSTGSGGLEELIDDLNSGKIMYAFCRLDDPKTSLPKFVLINWGAHITIMARTEDDVDPSLVLDKLSKATASQFSFKQRVGPTENTKPVGSVYKRIVPQAEINPSERDKFWEREEAEERKRVEEEKRKQNEERKRLEEERRKRELEEAQRRDLQAKERARSIAEQRASEQTEGAAASSEQRRHWEEARQRDADAAELERKRRAEIARKERKEEAQSLIAQRTVNARAIFEQNTIYGKSYSNTSISSGSQQNSRRSSYETGPRPTPTTGYVATSITAVTGSSAQPGKLLNGQASIAPPSKREINNVPTQNTSQTAKPDTNDWNDVAEPSSEMPDLINHLYNGHMSQSERRVEAALAEAVANVTAASGEEPLLDGELEAHALYGDEGMFMAQPTEAFVPGAGLKARALYDYQAADDTEISFNPDDIITNVDQIDEGWWQGLAPDGTYGLFPANYVEVIGE